MQRIAPDILNVICRYVAVNRLVSFFVGNDLDVGRKFVYDARYSESSVKELNRVFGVFRNVVLVGLNVRMYCGCSFDGMRSANLRVYGCSLSDLKIELGEVVWLRVVCVVGDNKSRMSLPMFYVNELELCSGIRFLKVENFMLYNLSCLKKLGRLREVRFWQCRWTWGDLHVFSRIGGLRVLELPCCKLNRYDVECIKSCKGIKKLMLNQTFGGWVEKYEFDRLECLVLVEDRLGMGIIVHKRQKFGKYNKCKRLRRVDLWIV